MRVTIEVHEYKGGNFLVLRKCDADGIERSYLDSDEEFLGILQPAADIISDKVIEMLSTPEPLPDNFL